MVTQILKRKKIQKFGEQLKVKGQETLETEDNTGGLISDCQELQRKRDFLNL